MVAGLYNDTLEYQPEFSYETVELIKKYLNIHRKPICFVAHNGNRFDYPILREHFHRVVNELSDDILCIDSLLAFKDLHTSTSENEINNVGVVAESQKEANFRLSDNEMGTHLIDQLSNKIIPSASICSIDKHHKNTTNVPMEFLDGYDLLLSQAVEDMEKKVFRKSTAEEIQKINETTPRKTLQAHSVSINLPQQSESPCNSKTRLNISKAKKQLFG